MRNAPHRFEILRREIVGNDDGTPVYDDVISASVWGVFSILDAKELEEWRGQGVTASARVPLTTILDPDDRVRVVVPDHPEAAGDWQIATVRWTPIHLRLMLKRTG